MCITEPARAVDAASATNIAAINTSVPGRYINPRQTLEQEPDPASGALDGKFSRGQETLVRVHPVIHAALRPVGPRAPT